MRLATRVLAKGDARDPWWVTGALRGDPHSIPRSRSRSRARLTVVPINPQIIAGIDQAAEVLRRRGATRWSAWRRPSIMKPAQAWFDVLASEIVHFLGPVARGARQRNHSDHLRGLTSASETPVDAAGYRQGIADRTALTREMERLSRPVIRWCSARS